MKKSVPIIALALLSLAARPARADGLMESWYMSRARSNMKIGNYKAAIEAYEKALEKDPDNTEAMRSLGFAYEAQGLKDKSVEQFDRYLEKHPEDSEVDFKQAEALSWSRYQYRRQDALKYYRQGLEHKDDERMRLKYARQLASSKETNDEAIHQYQKVLARDPGNAEAHRGLAKAYAWNGENDKAVYESEQARKEGSHEGEMTRLEQQLRKGREPEISGKVDTILQPGTNYNLTGFDVGIEGRTDLTPFVTGTAEAGFETYSGQGSQASSGGFGAIDIEGRLEETRKIEARLGYHSLAPYAGGAANANATSSTGMANLVFKGEYSQDNGDWSVAPGFERELKYDSFLALAGSQVVGNGLGQARSNLFYTDFKWNKGSPLAFGVKPYAGFVTALSVPSNVELGVDAALEYPLTEAGRTTLKLVHFMQFQHYGMDQSATSGAGAAGYFSPQFFMNQNPKLVARFTLSSETELNAGGGPALQYVQDNSLSGFQLGGEADVDCTSRIANDTYLRGQAGFLSIGGAYNRIQIGAALVRKF